MNATKLLAKYEMLAEAAHRTGAYKCAQKWSIKAEKLEAAISALQQVEEIKVPNQKKSLRDRNPAIFKPQNRFDTHLTKKIAEKVRDWFVNGYGLPGHQAMLLASRLVDDAISERIKCTSPTAPDILFSDNDKIESVFMAATHKAIELDEAEKLADLLDELEADEARHGAGNSI